MKSTIIAAVFGIVSVFGVGCAGPRANLEASSAYTATDVVATSSDVVVVTPREMHADRRPAEHAHH
jgi:hypothetical protein